MAVEKLGANTQGIGATALLNSANWEFDMPVVPATRGVPLAPQAAAVSTVAPGAVKATTTSAPSASSPASDQTFAPTSEVPMTVPTSAPMLG